MVPFAHMYSQLKLTDEMFGLCEIRVIQDYVGTSLSIFAHTPCLSEFLGISLNSNVNHYDHMKRIVKVK